MSPLHLRPRESLPPGLRALRPAQLHQLHLVDTYRLLACVWRRQGGKTTGAAHICLRKMAAKPDHTVIFGTLKLDLGREIILKEAELLRKIIQAYTSTQTKLDLADTSTRKLLPANLTLEDFADLYESSRLELRLHHTNTRYSRTKVVAFTTQAVGETGDLIGDEIGRIRNFREVWEAITPIISSNPAYRCLLTTTPPPDDTHYSYQLLAPPADAIFPIRPEGNLYESSEGITVHRVDARDFHAAGLPLYDLKTGQPLTPEEARAKDPDKDGWDRNYAVAFKAGGTGACSKLHLHTAQTRGLTHCRYFHIETDQDLATAAAWLTAHLADYPLGIGHDVATTEQGTSNPSSLTLTEARGIDYHSRAIITWKTQDPETARKYVRTLVLAAHARPKGGPARALSVDASSERYYCRDLATHLADLLPVHQVVSGATAPAQPGQAPTNYKTQLGDLYTGTLHDNHLTLPPDRYITEDHGLVRKERGAYTTEVDNQGRHGDTFDSGKLSLHALTTQANTYTATVI